MGGGLEFPGGGRADRAEIAEHRRRLLEEAAVPVVTFSAEGRQADWRAVEVVLEPEGSTFTVTLPFGSAHLPPDRLAPARNVHAAAPAGASAAGAFVEEALHWLPPGDTIASGQEIGEQELGGSKVHSEVSGVGEGDDVFKRLVNVVDSRPAFK